MADSQAPTYQTGDTHIIQAPKYELLKPMTEDQVRRYMAEMVKRYLFDVKFQLVVNDEPCPLPPEFRMNESKVRLARFFEIAKDYYKPSAKNIHRGSGTTCGVTVNWMMFRIRYLNPYTLSRNETVTVLDENKKLQTYTFKMESGLTGFAWIKNPKTNEIKFTIPWKLSDNTFRGEFLVEQLPGLETKLKEAISSIEVELASIEQKLKSYEENPPKPLSKAAFEKSQLEAQKEKLTNKKRKYEDILRLLHEFQEAKAPDIWFFNKFPKPKGRIAAHYVAVGEKGTMSPKPCDFFYISHDSFSKALEEAPKIADPIERNKFISFYQASEHVFWATEIGSPWSTADGGQSVFRKFTQSTEQAAMFNNKRELKDGNILKLINGKAKSGKYIGTAPPGWVDVIDIATERRIQGYIPISNIAPYLMAGAICEDIAMLSVVLTGKANMVELDKETGKCIIGGSYKEDVDFKLYPHPTWEAYLPWVDLTFKV
jgi:hypothetical protein